MENILSKTSVQQFDWDTRWLSGEQYQHMLKNVSNYTQKFGLHVVGDHPRSIYFTPQNGQIYFLRGTSLGSEFGFPRVKQRKWYRWKKMNFTTDLPIHRPVVRYVVATGIKNAWFFPHSPNQKTFRMHAVMLTKNPEFILCHVLAVPKHKSQDYCPRIYSSPKIARTDPQPNWYPRENYNTTGIHILMEAVELFAQKESQACKQRREGDQENEETEIYQHAYE